MHLEIITPEKVIFDDEVDEVIAPTVNGQIAILPHHVNLLTQLTAEELIIKAKGKEQYLGITGGFLQIQNDKITVLSDYAVRAEHIEVQKAMEAQKRAEEILKKKRENISEEDFSLAQGELLRSILELKVAQRRRKNMTPPR